MSKDIKEITKTYVDLYHEALPLLQKQSCDALNAARDGAIKAFAQTGFPTRKVERYRYTDVAEAFDMNYGLSLAPLTIKDVDYVYTMKNAPVKVEQYYNTVAAQAGADPVTALNTALGHDALIVYVPKGTKVSAPIRIENMLSGDQDTMVVRRVLIVMEESSEATVFFVDHATQGADQHYLTLQVVEVIAKDNAHLDMYEMEETHERCRRFNNVYIQTGRDTVVRHNNITLNNGITRNGIDVYMKGTGADITLNGAVIADRHQHVDNNTVIDHQVGQCNSNELYKYVVDDKAVCAFAGKILVREGAQQTTSQETNNNMCASNEARMYTQPMLEIYADDVKCAHGSTVGVMDEQALFYMQQRGIPVETARTLLKNAFISEVIDEMKWDSFRERLHILTDQRLSKEDRCGTCKICH